MDVIKDIPGYKVILKAVLKSQIQQLVEQLASVTDEESVLLTASVSDGSISHLGSNSGKNFLENHEDIKSQFLGFCLKYHHQKKQEEKDREEAEKLTSMVTSRFTSPSYMGVGSPMFPSPGQQEPHPIALTRARAVRPRVRHSPYTVQGPPARGKVLVGEASATVGGVIKIEPDNPQAVHLNLSGGDSVSELQGNVQSSFLESKQLVSSSPSQSGGLNHLDKDFSASESSVASQSVAPEHKSGSVSDSQDGATGSDNNESGKLHTSKSPSGNVSVKLEAITDAEMELEITGVEPGTQPVMPSGSQDWSQQGTMGYDPMGAAGNQSDMQAGNDGYMDTEVDAHPVDLENKKADAPSVEHVDILDQHSIEPVPIVSTIQPAILTMHQGLATIQPAKPSFQQLMPSFSPSKSTIQPATSKSSESCSPLGASVDIPLVRGHYKLFSSKQKLDICDYARTHGQRNASRKFKVPKSTICSWMKNDLSQQRNKVGHLPRSGRPLTYEQELENKCVKFILEQRDLQNAVSIEELCAFAKAVIQSNHPNFKASRNWAVRFMHRHEMLLRAKTSMAQRLPADLEDKISSFHEFVNKHRLENEFEDKFIINMDETPVYFHLVPGKTIDMKGNKTVKIRTSGSEKRHFTVVLAVSAAGDVLPPMIIFKGKRELKLSKEPPTGWIVTVQEKGWLDEDMMRRWIREIYLKFTKKERSLLVLDSFRAHTTEVVLKDLRKGNVLPAIIPGGCTSKIQPLDVSINRPFKSELRKSWSSYMKETSRTLKAGEKVKAAMKELVIDWLESAVKYISDQRLLVVKSFKVCGISNVLNGCEDTLIREEVEVAKFLDSDNDDTEFEGFTPADIPSFD